MTTQTNTTLVKEAVELKPCPFCGVPMVMGTGGSYFFHPEDGCVLRNRAWYHYDTEAWNTRASLPTDDDDTVERVALALAEAGHAAISYRAGASVDYWDTLARAAIHTLIGRVK